MVMTEQWKQFSLYPPNCRNKMIPTQVLHGFLPQFIASVGRHLTTWHILFEPAALIRFQSTGHDASIMVEAKSIAVIHGLIFEPGDCSHELNSELTYPGEDYGGEAEFYGPELWKAAVQFLKGCSVLSVEISKLPQDKQIFMMRKFVHIYLCALGCNVLEESALHLEWSKRRMDMYNLGTGRL